MSQSNFTSKQRQEIEEISRSRARKYVARVLIGYVFLGLGTGYAIVSNSGSSLHQYESKAAVTRVSGTRERCDLTNTLFQSLEKESVKDELLHLKITCAEKLNEAERIESEQ